MFALFTEVVPAGKEAERLDDMNVRVVVPSGLAGKATALAEKLRQTFGQDVLARAALTRDRAARYPRVLFAGVTPGEADYLRSEGIEEARGDIAHAFADSPEALVFRCMCLGRTHRVAFDGAALEALDHSRDEIRLLRSIGEQQPCTRLHGRTPLDVKLFELPPSMLRWWFSFQKAESETWAMVVGPNQSGRASLVVFPSRIPHPFNQAAHVRVAAVRWVSADLTQIQSLIEFLGIPWSPVAPAEVAMLLRKETGSLVIRDPRRLLRKRL